MLFRVRGKTGATVYLLGSVHLLTADASRLPAEVDSAFSHASVVAFEVNTDTAKARAQELVLRGRNPTGVTLRSLLSAPAAARTDTLFHAYGMSLDMLASLKPWLASVMMSQLAMQKNGFQPQFGVDQQIDARAHAAGKEIVGLESMDAQLSLFDGLSAGDQEKMLVSGHTPDSASIELSRVKEAWVNGNLSQLDSLLNRTIPSPTLLSAMVTDRNKAWTPEIEDLLHGSCDALIVVGAGHLVGKQGLLELLRLKGYSIEQL
jgi:hypothetical protein